MADDCRVSPDRQEWDKLLKDLGLSGPRQGQGSGGGGRGGGRGGNRGGGGGGGAGQQGNWPQQQQPFQGNPGMYSIQQQQAAAWYDVPSTDTRRRRRRRPLPSPQHTMGSPARSAAATATAAVTGGAATWSLWPTRRVCLGPQQQPVRGGRTPTSTCHLFGSRHWIQSQRQCLYTP